MMNKPTLEQLMSKGSMDNKYALVIALAKRARRIASGEKTLVEADTVKPVSLAALELAEGKLHWYRRSDYVVNETTESTETKESNTNN